MFIYNVTIKPNWSIHDRWLQWMCDAHMQEMIATGCFKESQLVRLLDTDEKEGPTYAAQFMADSKADYDRYIELYATRLRQQSFDLWGDQFVAFRTLMQLIQKI